MRDYGWRIERKGDQVSAYIADPRGGEFRVCAITDGNRFLRHGAGEAFAEMHRPYHEAEVRIHESGEMSIFRCKTREEDMAIREGRGVGGVPISEQCAAHDAFVREWAV